MGDLVDAVKVFPEENVDKVEASTRVQVQGKDLNLTLLMVRTKYWCYGITLESLRCHV
jgi:hypothetical protein